jgi:hypothetical protein
MDRNQARRSAGCVSKRMSPSGSMTQGCTLRVQKCVFGRSATKVPGGAVPGFAPLQIQVPHSAQTHWITVRLLSAVRWKDRGSPPTKWHASAATTSAEEKAPPVSRWQVVQWQV